MNIGSAPLAKDATAKAPVSEPRLVYDAPKDSAQITVALRQRDQIMAASINTLLNQLVPLKSSGSVLSPATQTAVIEAVVLSNSPLLRTGDGNNQQTQVTLSHNQQRLELTTQTSIPVGARVQLKITADNLAVILSINDKPTAAANPSVNPSAAQSGRLSSVLLPQAPLVGNVTPNLNSATPAITSHLTASAATPTKPPPAGNHFHQLRPLIEQTLRQALPQQQSLPTLLPIINQVLSQPHALPKELVIALTHLKRQFPQAEQLQQPAQLKRAMRDSGTFFETKLAQQILARQQGQAATGQKPSNHPDTPINRDIKGLIERALPLINKALQINTTAGSSTTTAAANNQELLQLLRQEFAVPLAGQSTTGNATKAAEGGKPKDAGLDIILRQLGRQLLATLAKTQISQLESLVARNPASAETPAPANSWTLELPILHGKHIDNLQLRIDQQQAEQQAAEDKRQKQWTVTLNFDLHQLGKMQVQLTILDTQVSAAVWSQQQQTHEQVRKAIGELKTDLERVGVTVKQVECHWGEAPKKPSELYQQLVDVRT